jgi:hypothetical protein
MAKRQARLSKGRNLSRNKKIEKAKSVCEMYATDQYTLDVCLQENGITSDSTWYKWMEEIEEIGELYKEAKAKKHEVYKSHLVTRARTSLERYLDGFTIEVVERTGEIIQLGDGQEEMRTRSVKQKTMYIKPSMRAIELVLTNLDGRNFTKNPEPYKAGNEKMPHKVQIELLNGSTPPVTSEDDIADIDTTP